MFILCFRAGFRRFRSHEDGKDGLFVGMMRTGGRMKKLVEIEIIFGGGSV